MHMEVLTKINVKSSVLEDFIKKKLNKNLEEKRKINKRNFQFNLNAKGNK